MTVLVTGAAGFIGFHAAQRLLGRGEEVIGVDSLDPYYSVALKRARLAGLERHSGFSFRRADLGAPGALAEALGPAPGLRRVVHLAAQPGVRHSLENPFAYVRSNVAGHLEILEFCRRRDGFEHLVYASSSAVYGDARALPFSADDRSGRSISLYGATKAAGEEMSRSYGHLHGLPQTGLRFFTVYGPWGRPDMVPYVFAEAIMAGRPIRIFNRGDMRRDFTFVDDIVSGLVAALDRPPPAAPVPHRVYNLARGESEPLGRVVALLEDALGREAEKIMEPMQPGDMQRTWGDIGPAERDLGYAPKTPVDAGIPAFAEWFLAHRGF